MPQYITTIIQIPRQKDGSWTTDSCLINRAGYSWVLPVYLHCTVEEYGAKRIIK